ncbi:hypothetical protein ACFZAT_26115 [Streptomyces sp. NPDC008163]|uniref:DUF7848 domain-containing protein n=1 Tax=Streptomyces sp. NPDC008163 TaxID=3364818 RepID=UPI0036EA8DC5
MTRRFRLMNWSLVPTDDEPDTPAVTHTFRCYTLDDDDKECGAESGPQADVNAAQRWAFNHWKSTDQEHSAFGEWTIRPWGMHQDGPA